jgi:hypothetical protein
MGSSFGARELRPTPPLPATNAPNSPTHEQIPSNIVLADKDDFAGMNEEWLKRFPANPPARQGAKRPARIPGLKVSIAAIAEA